MRIAIVSGVDEDGNPVLFRAMTPVDLDAMVEQGFAASTIETTTKAEVRAILVGALGRNEGPR